MLFPLKLRSQVSHSPMIVIDGRKDDLLEFALGFSHDVNVVYVEEDQVDVLIYFVVFVPPALSLVGHRIHGGSRRENLRKNDLQLGEIHTLL